MGGGGACARQSVDQWLEWGLWASGAHVPRCQQQGRPGALVGRGGGSYWTDQVSETSYCRNPRCICICSYISVWICSFYLRSFSLISWSREQDKTVGGCCIWVFLSLLIYVAGHIYMHISVALCVWLCMCLLGMYARLYYWLGLGTWSCSSCLFVGLQDLAHPSKTVEEQM